MSVRDERYFRDLDSGAWETREKAYDELFREGQAAVATLVSGAIHPRPRVRAACIALMDHLADERCCQPLRLALRDVSPLVRRHAVHSLGCQRCKVRPLSIDVVGALVERVLVDSSPRVRRVAAHQLGLQPYDPRAAKALGHVIAGSQDAALVSRATRALGEQLARAARSNAAGLP